MTITPKSKRKPTMGEKVWATMQKKKADRAHAALIANDQAATKLLADITTLKNDIEQARKKFAI